MDVDATTPVGRNSKLILIALRAALTVLPPQLADLVAGFPASSIRKSFTHLYEVGAVAGALNLIAALALTDIPLRGHEIKKAVE